MTNRQFSLNELNLASNPFRNRLPFWMGMVCLLILAAGICVWTVRDAKNARAVEQDRAGTLKTIQTGTNRELAELENTRKRLSANGTKLTPNQELAIKEAIALTGKRQISWSRLMAQLERELPGNIKIVTIGFSTTRKAGPAAAEDAGIPLTLTVRSDKPETITNFIRSADRRGIFRFDPTAQVVNAKDRTASSNETEFVMNGRYHPNGITPQTNPREVSQ